MCSTLGEPSDSRQSPFAICGERGRRRVGASGSCLTMAACLGMRRLAGDLSRLCLQVDLDLRELNTGKSSIAQAGPMLARRNSYGNRMIRAGARDFVRANAWPIALIAVFSAVICFLFRLMLDGYVAGLLTGIFASTMVGMLGLVFLLVSGQTFRVSGVMGETNTADVLRTARRRNYVYEWIDNLEIDSGDVDHLVVTPAGILAIDSKWHSHGLNEARLESDALAALASAGRSRSILRSVHQYRPDVKPLVVVWGGDQSEAHGQHRLGVEFVAGGHFRDWLRTRAATGNAFNSSQAKALVDDLEAFKRRIRPPRRSPTRGASKAPSARRGPRRSRV
jgi:hypothetical protein